MFPRQRAHPEEGLVDLSQFCVDGRTVEDLRRFVVLGDAQTPR